MLPTPLLRRAVTAFAAVALLLGAASCGDDGTDAPDGDAAAGGSGWDSPDAGRADGAPTIAEPDGPPPERLVVDDLTEGTGTAVAPGMIALVDYVGANHSDGTVFDSSYGRAPFPVLVGAGRVIPGWDEGLVGMKPGGRRQLTIPPDMAYGDTGQGDIGPGETLIFVIDLRAALERPEPPAAPGGVAAELVITDLAEGTGDRTVEAGDQVSVHYVGVHGADGTPFDASWDRGDPIDLVVGQGQVIEGWDRGLLGMKVGGRRRLVIPGELAYGAAGRPPTIGPDETLVFDVDLVGIN